MTYKVRSRLIAFWFFDMDNFYQLDINTKKVNLYPKAIELNSIFVLNFILSDAVSHYV